MYYSTWLKSDPEIHCIGAAKSKTVGGPYEPELQPLACPVDQGGAIDPSGYQDPATGLRYVVYKVDGNHNGNGGSCGNTVKPVVPTPILLQQVGSDGVSPISAPVPILDRDDSDGPLVEAPSLYRTADGTYFLFFSSGCYTDTSYDAKYATATSITGPYTKASAPLLKSGDGPNLNGPGGASMAADGQFMVFHANLNAPGQPLKRAMFTAKPTFSGMTVTI
jgi:beta-xylosidase